MGSQLALLSSTVRDVIMESVQEVLSMLPVLILVFLLVEFVSHGTRTHAFAKALSHKTAGPVAASALGLLPQCGFSVATTLLWLQGLVPAGSLIASYIATSDEALPLLLADTSTTRWVVPILGFKFVWGVIVGIIGNFALRGFQERKDVPATCQDHPSSEESGKSRCTGPTLGYQHADSCEDTCVGEKATWKERVFHALSRTVRTASMVFVISTVLNLVAELGGSKVFGLILKPGIWQPAAASLIGLLPSCATSVALAEGFRTGFLSFPGLLAGLTSNAGMGLLVLVKESRSLKSTAIVIGALTASAIGAGYVASLLLR